MKKHYLFTLIELLVVVSVILILVSLITPITQKALTHARLMICFNNLRQINMAALAYAEDNNQYVCGDTLHKNMFFPIEYAPYLNGDKLEEQNYRVSDKIDEVVMDNPMFQCPEVDDSIKKLNYTLNSIDFEKYEESGRWDATDFQSLMRLPTDDTSQLVYLAENNRNTEHYELWDLWSPEFMTFNAYGAINANPRMIDFSDTRHAYSTTLSFFDGHVEIREINPEYIPIRLFNPLVE